MLSPIAAAMFVLAGCGGGHAASVPSAPVGLGVPYGYRAIHVWHADLSAPSVQDVVVASEGPPVTSQGFHSRDIRVLVWDPLAHQWTVAFDAQKTFARDGFGDPGASNGGPGYISAPPSKTPLLDPKADVTLGSVRFVQLLQGKRQQLAFSASMSYGGSGVPGVLAVVDFAGGIADVVYTWSGEGLRSWSVANRVLSARAEYWTPADAHCCPITTYTFTIAQRKGYLTETSDSRSWLGVEVKETKPNEWPTSPLQVTQVVDKSPAAGHLRVGDVLLGVANAPKKPKAFHGMPQIETVFDELILMHPGQTAKLLVERDGARVVVPVTLGSQKDAFGIYLPANDYTAAAL
jgi:hypothetical protein